jgi:23S rRNA pseudouridine955/2504/2580 synthase
VTLIAAGGDSGRRLDRVLRKALPEIPLSALYRLFRKGSVLVDGKPASGAERVRAGSVIRIPDSAGPKTRVPKTPDSARRGPKSASKKSALELLFEGSGLLVLNKPAGLAVHGPDADNLNLRVQSYLEGKIPASLSFRPGPLHRLDKPTSGIVVFSSCLEGAKTFSRLLGEGKLVKTYLAVLEGDIEEEALWNDSLFRDKELRKSIAGQGGDSVNAGNSRAKNAVTRLRPLCRSKSRELTLALVKPETGRTHQIRAQAALHHVPLWGDRKYGSKGKGGFFLHALSLEFPPEEPSFPRLIQAPLPDAFSAFLREHFGPAHAPVP